MVKTFRSQRIMFYAIISIAKTILYSLYYKSSENMADFRVCITISSYIDKVKIIIPSSLREKKTHLRKNLTTKG